jgi:ATP-dependent DNA ligase
LSSRYRPLGSAGGSRVAVKGGSKRLVYYLFHILYLGGFDLREAALVVSKRAESKYASGGRSPYWIKVPCRQRDTFAIVGWANKNGKFDGIYLGKTENGALEQSHNEGLQHRFRVHVGWASALGQTALRPHK